MRQEKGILPLKFDWDEGNKDKNWLKHKVTFREGEEVFFNQPVKIFEDIKHSQKENRYYALGKTNEKRRLSIIFTIRKNKIRIISARNMSQKERKLYEKNSSL